MKRKLFVLMEMCCDLDDRSVEDVLDDLEGETIDQIGRNYEFGQYAYQIEVQEGEDYKIEETVLLVGRNVLQKWLDDGIDYEEASK